MSHDPGKRQRRSIRLKGYDYAQAGAYFVTVCTQSREPFLGEIEGGRMRLNPAGEMVWRWWHELDHKYPTVRTDAAIVMPNHFHGIIIIAGQPQTGQPHRAAPTDDDMPVGATLRGRPDTNPDATSHLAQPETVQPHRAAPTDDGMPVGATLRGRPDVDGDVMADAGRAGTGGDAPVGATLRGRPDTNPDATFHLAQPETGQPHRAAPTGDDMPVGATLRGRPDMDDEPGIAPALGEIVGWFKTMTTNEYIRGVKQQGWPPFPGRVWQRNYYEHIVRNRDSLERIRDYILTNPERWDWDRENPHRCGLDEFESWIFGSPADKEG